MSNNQFMTVHNDWDHHLLLPFVVVRGQSDSVFIDPIWGIKIGQVMADGTRLYPERFDADLDDLNLRKIQIGNTSFIYQVQFGWFVFAKRINEEEDYEYELERYTLPAKAKHIRIEYHSRESDKVLGPACVLNSLYA